MLLRQYIHRFKVYLKDSETSETIEYNIAVNTVSETPTKEEWAGAFSEAFKALGYHPDCYISEILYITTDKIE